MISKVPDANILIMAYFPNSVGYAWKNIYRLFEQICDRVQNEFSGKVFISFPSIDWNNNFINLKKFNNVTSLDVWPTTFSSVFRLLNFIFKNKIRYVYLTDQTSTHYIYGLMRLTGVRKIIIHSRVSVPSPLPAIEKKILVLFVKRLIRRLPLLNAQKIYAVSDFVRNRLIFKHGIRENSIVTILNGINVKRFEREYTNPYPENDMNVKVFVCGRATPEKGFQFLIKAISIVNFDSNRKCSLYIAGNGPYLESLKKLVCELKVEQHVHLLGEINDVTAFQKHADVNVVPSIWGDACPSSISESLCAKRPLICTNAGGIPEMVKSIDGTDVAVIVEPSDTDALVKKLKQIIDSPESYLNLAFKGYQHAMSLLTEDAYYSRFFNVFLKDVGLQNTKSITKN